MINIDVVNQTSSQTDAACKAVTSALQVQVTRDFYPIWGIDAQLHYVPKGGTPNPARWQLVLLDNADQAGALGYHELTSTGLPLGKVFVETTIQNRGKWSVTASHELLEMLGDPYINCTVFNQATNTTGEILAYEVCDACEDDRFGYAIYSTIVSDFVTPEWFEPAGTMPGAKYDFKRHCTEPFQLLTGGYIGAFEVTAGSGWQQIFGKKSDMGWKLKFADGHYGAVGDPADHPKGTRRHRRTIPLSQRRRSER